MKKNIPSVVDSVKRHRTPMKDLDRTEPNGFIPPMRDECSCIELLAICF